MVITFYFFFHTSSIRLIDFVNGFMLEQIPVFTKNFRCSLNFLQEKKNWKKKKIEWNSIATGIEWMQFSITISFYLLILRFSWQPKTCLSRRNIPFLQQLTLLQAITIRKVRKITPFIKFTIGDQQDHFPCPLTLITSHISIIFPILLINRYRKNCLHNYINLFIINFCYISYPKVRLDAL